VTMSLEMLSALVGSLLPMLVAVVNRSHWAPAVKGLVVVLSSVAAGAVTAWLAGSLTGLRWTESALIIVGAAVVAYRHFWQPTGIAPAIERATTPGG
jgi:ABC-type Fe3+-siderophore transport system permease subunit